MQGGPDKASVPDLILRRCRIEGKPDLADVAIRGEVIATIASQIRTEAATEIDAGGGLLSTAFVEPHIHLDKVLVATMLGANRSGTLAEAISLLHASKAASTVEQVARRASQVIQRAVMAGTTTIRSHVDVDTIGGLTPLKGVLQAARENEDICRVEIVAFPQEGIRRDPGAGDLMREAMKTGATVVGGMPHWEQSSAESDWHIRFCLDLAREHDADVDMHVDETDDPRSRTLELLLDATAEYGWQGRVTAGHCCAMVSWERAYREQVIAKAASLSVNIIANPATNLMLQGRDDQEPRRRGIVPVKDLIAAGVRVACGQDCVNDAFYPFGVADQLQVALILCHAAQLSTPDEITRALKMIREEAAAVLRLPSYGLEVGCRADLIILDAENAQEALRIQADRRFVIHRGRLVAQTDSQRRLHRLHTPAAIS